MPTYPLPAPVAETASVPPLDRPRKVYRLGLAVEQATLDEIAPVKVRRVGGPVVATSTSAGFRPRKVKAVSTAIEQTVPGSVFPEPVITEGEFTAAVLADDRVPVWRAGVDWTRQDYTGPASDLTATVREIEVEREIVGDLPTEAGVVDGYSSGRVTLRLGGTAETAYRADPDARMTLAEELSPYRTDSPLYGQTLTPSPMRVDLGFLTERGPKMYRQITGVLRKIRMSESDRSVVADGLDPSELIREIITLPTYAEFVTHAKRRPWAITVNTQWIVDYVLRRNNIFASPPVRDDAFIACTGHGGLVSERGFNGAPISINASTPPGSGLWVDDQHPWGMLGTPENAQGGSVGYQEFHGTPGTGDTVPMRFENGYGIAVSFWCHIGTYMGMSSSFENRIMQYRPTAYDEPRLFINGFGNGDIYCGVVDENGYIAATPRVSTGASRWTHIGVHWRWITASTCRITIRTNGITRQFDVGGAAVSVVETSTREGYRRVQQTRMMLFRSWTNMQTWITPNAPTLAEWQALENHVSEAEVGRGNNELLYLPDVASVESWDLLKQVVGAEYGVHGFDPAGRYSFRPRSDAYSGTPDIDLDVDMHLADVAYSVSSDSVRNVVGYSTKPRYHDGDLHSVVKAEDVFQFLVPARQVRVYDLDWPFGAAGWQGGRLPYHYQPGAEVYPGWAAPWVSETVRHGWTYSTKGASGNWTIMDNVANVVVTYVQLDSRHCRVIVDNTGGTMDVRLATAADPANPGDQPGDPALRIGGWPLVDQPGHVAAFRDDESIARTLSPRTLALDESEWRQTPAALDTLCQQLLTALAHPVTVLEDLPVRADPRTQVGMLARLRFRDEAAQPVIGTVVRTRRTLSEEGMIDQLSVRPLPEQTLAPPGWSFFIDISRYQYDRADPINLPLLHDLGYIGCIAKLGQGGGVTAGNVQYGQSIDPYWTTARDTARALWPTTFACYWYVGGMNGTTGTAETPESQAARAKAAIGDVTIPIALDYEDGSGDWANLLAVLGAFQAAGLRVTMIYASHGWLNARGVTNLDSDTGLNFWRARYPNNTVAHPRVTFDILDNPEEFGLGTTNGGTPDIWQFTQYGSVTSGMNIDVNAVKGGRAQLAQIMNGTTL
jgi:hypothetical protein